MRPSMLLLVSSRTATWMSGFAGATDAVADPAIANAMQRVMRSAMKERVRRMRSSLVILLLDVRRGESATATYNLLRAFYLPPFDPRHRATRHARGRVRRRRERVRAVVCVATARA